MKKPNAYKRIRAGMLANERSLFSRILRDNRKGETFRLAFFAGPWRSALDRLADKGRIKQVRRGYFIGWVALRAGGQPIVNVRKLH